jgi:hypothetical protein
MLQQFHKLPLQFFQMRFLKIILINKWMRNNKDKQFLKFFSNLNMMISSEISNRILILIVKKVLSKNFYMHDFFF